MSAKHSSSLCLIHALTGVSVGLSKRKPRDQAIVSAMKKLNRRVAQQSGMNRPSPDHVIETSELEDFSDAIISTER